MNVDKPIDGAYVVGIDEILMPEDVNLGLYRCPKCNDEFPKTKAAPGPNKKRWGVYCTNPKCKAHLKYLFATEEEAVMHWNLIKRSK